MSRMFNTKKSTVATRIIAVLSIFLRAGMVTWRDMKIIAANIMMRLRISFLVIAPRLALNSFTRSFSPGMFAFSGLKNTTKNTQSRNTINRPTGAI